MTHPCKCASEEVCTRPGVFKPLQNLVGGGARVLVSVGTSGTVTRRLFRVVSIRGRSLLYSLRRRRRDLSSSKAPGAGGGDVDYGAHLGFMCPSVVTCSRPLLSQLLSSYLLPMSRLMWDFPWLENATTRCGLLCSGSFTRMRPKRKGTIYRSTHRQCSRFFLSAASLG